MALATLALVGCGLSIPADPDGTLETVTGGALETVTGGALEVGVSPSPPFTDLSGAEPTGREVELVEPFAQSIEAEISWTEGGEEKIVEQFSSGELDLVIGGITDETPWSSDAAPTRAYAETTEADSSTTIAITLVGLVMGGSQAMRTAWIEDMLSTVPQIAFLVALAASAWASAAALFISIGIIWDSIRNPRGSVLDLMDMRATTVDKSEPEPLIRRIDQTLRRQAWVRDAASRVRDEGHVFHVEAYVVPKRRKVDVQDIDRDLEDVVALDWHVQDVAFAVMGELPSPEAQQRR